MQEETQKRKPGRPATTPDGVTRIMTGFTLRKQDHDYLKGKDRKIYLDLGLDMARLLFDGTKEQAIQAVNNHFENKQK